MRRLVVFCLIVSSVLGSYGLCSSAWRLVLKNGETIVCDGAPIVVNDVYLFHGSDGKDGELAGDQVDREKTDRANKAPERRSWRMSGESVKEAPERPSRDVLNFGDADFEAEVLNSKTPVLVDFWATWCGYCLKIAPAVDAIAAENAGKVRVAKVDIDKNPALKQHYFIRVTPTLLFFRQGRVVGRIEGAADKSAMIRMLQAGQINTDERR